MLRKLTAPSAEARDGAPRSAPARRRGTRRTAFDAVGRIARREALFRGLVDGIEGWLRGLGLGGFGHGVSLRCGIVPWRNFETMGARPP